MGTCNFMGMSEFGYVTYIAEWDEDYMMEAYPREEFESEDDSLTDEEYKDLLWKIYCEICEEDYHEAYTTMKPLVEELNESLIFHKFTIESGYYEGMEICYSQDRWGYRNSCAPYDPDDWAELACIYDEHEGCYFYDDVPKHQRRCRRLYEEECDAIIAWFDTVAREHGFSPMGCVARFCNGEAWYRRCSEYPVLEHHIGLDIGFSLGENPRTTDAWMDENILAPLWLDLERNFLDNNVEA